MAAALRHSDASADYVTTPFRIPQPLEQSDPSAIGRGFVAVKDGSLDYATGTTVQRAAPEPPTDAYLTDDASFDYAVAERRERSAP